MNTYADYLNTMTVKTLNTIAKDMKLKGYSKLRKAELIAFIDKAIEADWDVAHVHAPKVTILDTEAPADHDAIIALMAEILPITFSDAPAESASKAPEAATLPATTEAPETSSLEDLKYAYRAMRRTVNGMRAGAARLRCVGRLRNLSNELRSMGINNPAFL